MLQFLRANRQQNVLAGSLVLAERLIAAVQFTLVVFVVVVVVVDVVVWRLRVHTHARTCTQFSIQLPPMRRWEKFTPKIHSSHAHTAQLVHNFRAPFITFSYVQY